MSAVLGMELDGSTMVLTRGRDFKCAFQNLDDNGQLQDFPAGDLYFELQTGGERNCVQQVEVLGAQDGTYKLEYDGVLSDPIDFYNVATSPYDLTIDIRSALENIPAIGAGNVKVTRTALNPVWNLNITLSGTSQNEKQNLNVTNLLGWLGTTLGEGQMVLSYRSNDTIPISFESNAATIQAALEDLPQIGTGNVVVTGPVSNNFTIEYVGLLAARDVDLITVRAYERNADDFFGGGVVGNLLTRFSTATIQNGRRAVLDGRMMDSLSKKILEFFALFDNKLPMELEFVIEDNLNFTVVCRSTKGYAEVDLVTFDVIFSAAMLQGFFDDQTLLAGAVASVTVDQYWNQEYTVEFIEDAGLRPHPLLVGDATNLTNTITEITVTPEIEVSYIDLGQRALTLWHFEIAGPDATLKVESEAVELVPNRTKWQLVFQEEGEAAGGDAITRGMVRIQQ
jgi:hypothetical protein